MIEPFVFSKKIIPSKNIFPACLVNLWCGIGLCYKDTHTDLYISSQQEKKKH